MDLSADDKEALHEAFAEWEPVHPDQLYRMTGLNPKDLLAAGIVRTIGRWDTSVYRGDNFPTK